MASIALEGVTKVLSGAGGAGRRPGSEAGVRSGAATFPEDEGQRGQGEPGAPADGRALAGVDLAIRDGEALGVIGPSGCGKSTLLRVIAGLEIPDSGRVLYDGEDMQGVPPGERGIGMVFQNYALYPHMESRGNLGFFFRLRRREGEIDERVRVTAEIMGLGFEELLDRRPRTLSGGQQQRVAIGRCIARDPKLFLLDEPLSNLDARLRGRTRVELKRLLTRFKITTVYVTHDQTEAISLAERIAVMRRGRIEQVGTYRALYAHPANAFVAGFVGTPGSPPATLLPGKIDGGRLVLPGGHLPLPDELRRVAPGQAVLVGVRPEHVRVQAADADGAGVAGVAGGALAGKVETVEPLIADRAQLVHVALAGADGVTVTVRAPAEPLWVRGDDVRLTLDPEQMLLFDAESEQSLRP
jgi:ABC-type sugar transport system ATPase subunit